MSDCSSRNIGMCSQSLRALLSFVWRAAAGCRWRMNQVAATWSRKLLTFRLEGACASYVSSFETRALSWTHAFHSPGRTRPSRRRFCLALSSFHLLRPDIAAFPYMVEKSSPMNLTCGQNEQQRAKCLSIMHICGEVALEGGFVGVGGGGLPPWAKHGLLI